MTKITTPLSIRLFLIFFIFAFICEGAVVIALLHLRSLPWLGCAVAFASLTVNAVAITLALKRRSRGYEMLKWIAAFSLVWAQYGGPYLSALGVWAIALIAICVWLRAAALLALRREAAKNWMETARRGGGL